MSSLKSKELKLKKYGIYLLTIAVSMVCLMLASRSSFLYVFNNWDDANSYFSVGKGIFNGKMPYRDIFDQKGPWLYFIYGLGYLISHTTFIGVFMIEVLFGALDIFFFYKIISLYIEKDGALALASLVFAGVTSSRSFWWGGSAEEICMPFLTMGLYLLAKFFVCDYPEGKKMKFSQVFLGGLLAGMIAGIKFTGLGFFFAWMMLVGFSYVALRDVWSGVKACFIFLLGMFVPFVPWLVYFGVQKGLYDWYWGYVHVNVFVYNKMGAESLGLFGKVYALIKILYWIMLDNLTYSILMFLGLIASLLLPVILRHSRKRVFLPAIYVPVLFLFTFLGIFVGGRELPYYSLPLSLFSVYGAVGIGYCLSRGLALLNRYKERISFLIPLFGLAVSTVVVCTCSMNLGFMKVSRDDFFLYRFRDKVLETENPTLLNVGCLDAGLYTLCDVVPSCRWFQTQTLIIDEPENNPYLEQERYVREGLVDYVLVRDSIPATIDDHYELVDYEKFGWDSLEFDYFLYKKVR